MATRVLTCDADYRAELADALEAFGARVGAAQEATAWDGTSPCPGWTAADVVRHVTGSLYAFVVAMGGDGSGGAAAQQAEGAELVRGWEQARAVAGEVLGACEDPAATVPVMLGPRAMTAAFVMEALLRDVVIHTWDLARAAGGDEALPGHLVTAAAAALASLPLPIRRRGYYADPLAAPEDATDQDRLLAQAGRRA
jgi:uncharacterized protein (TIGR03086 family)